MWLEILLSSLRGNSSKTTINHLSVMLYPLNTLYVKEHVPKKMNCYMYIFLRLNTSRVTKMIFVTPKRYDEHTHPFYIRIHPPRTQVKRPVLQVKMSHWLIRCWLPFRGESNLQRAPWSWIQVYWGYSCWKDGKCIVWIFCGRKLLDNPGELTWNQSNLTAFILH